MGRRKVDGYFWSYALEFGWVRFPLANMQKKSCLQHLESCTRVWGGGGGQTHPLLIGSKKLCAISGVMHLSLGV